MSDQGRWWKLWASALDDPDLGLLPPMLWMAWTKLGAYLKVHGTRGTVSLKRPVHGVRHQLETHFQVASFDAVLDTIRGLPHVTLTETAAPVSYTVTYQNWAKFQEDHSTARVRAYRERTRTGETPRPVSEGAPGGPRAVKRSGNAPKKRREEKEEGASTQSPGGRNAQTLPSSGRSSLSPPSPSERRAAREHLGGAAPRAEDLPPAPETVHRFVAELEAAAGAAAAPPLPPPPGEADEAGLRTRVRHVFPPAGAAADAPAHGDDAPPEDEDPPP